MQQVPERPRKFLLSMLLGGAAALLLYPLIVGVLLPAPPDARWAKAILDIKDRLLGERKPPRVIFVGGSNVLFGINAREFEQATGLPSFNYGTHAGLGFEYILKKARALAAPGDVLVLSGEYGSLSPVLSYDLVTDVGAEYWLHYDRSYIFTRPLAETVRILYGLGAIGIWRELIFAGAGGEFVSINRWGDETETDGEGVASKLSPTQPPIPPERISPARPYLGEFFAEMKRRQVRVFFAWPSLMDDPAYHTPQYQQQFRRLADSITALGLPILGAPEDFFFARNEVYDTVFHPLNSGRSKRTQRLIKLLCRQNLDAMKCRQ